MSETPSTRQVGVIGPAGFTGSNVCVELLNRGYNVVGISRNPQAVGSHPRYTPRTADIDSISIEKLAEVFRGLDVVISAYGPHTEGASALRYSEYRISPLRACRMY